MQLELYSIHNTGRSKIQLRYAKEFFCGWYVGTIVGCYVGTTLGWYLGKVLYGPNGIV